MRGVRLFAWVLGLAAFTAAASGAQAGPVSAAAPLYLRLETPRGPVHVYRPAGVRPAAIVVYVHGFYTDADTAWSAHELERKCEASRLPAVFVVPEAPQAAGEPVRWLDLDDLLDVVAKARARLVPRRLPVVAVGHSAAYRTIASWLESPRLREVILVDALYGFEDAYEAWLRRPGRRMVVIVSTTDTWARPFARRFKRKVSLDVLDAAPPPRARRARLVMVNTRIGHLELVTEAEPLVRAMGLSRFTRKR
ncbi:MAG: hypothetical protein KA712_12900 [Myxococcales bacterium]|nr:hypothetical protein [Myxococcales bacterium]